MRVKCKMFMILQTLDEADELRLSCVEQCIYVPMYPFLYVIHFN